MKGEQAKKDMIYGFDDLFYGARHMRELWLG